MPQQSASAAGSSLPRFQAVSISMQRTCCFERPSRLRRCLCLSRPCLLAVLHQLLLHLPQSVNCVACLGGVLLICDVSCHGLEVHAYAMDIGFAYLPCCTVRPAE